MKLKRFSPILNKKETWESKVNRGSSPHNSHHNKHHRLKVCKQVRNEEKR